MTSKRKRIHVKPSSAPISKPFCVLCGGRHSFSEQCDPARVAEITEMRRAAVRTVVQAQGFQSETDHGG